MRELFFYFLNGAAVRIGGAIKRIGSAPGAKYSIAFCYDKKRLLRLKGNDNCVIPEILYGLIDY